LENEEALKEGTYIFVAKRAILTENYQKIKNSLKEALKYLRAYK